MEVSNYIKMRDQMQERFLTYDQIPSFVSDQSLYRVSLRNFKRCG